MAGGKLSRREVPWCTVFLVSAALFCHSAVLLGNLQTAAVMGELGTSTLGWSKVGLGLSRAMRVELDSTMLNVTSKIIDSLKHMEGLQHTIDFALSIIGNATDVALAVVKAARPALLQEANASAALSRLSRLGPLIIRSVDRVLNDTVAQIEVGLDQLLGLLRPVLLQVAEWNQRFSDQLQSGVETFSVSLDRAQKLFDQVMSQLNGGGARRRYHDEMLRETFNLFDVSHTGLVSIEDLHNVGRLYAITALSGNKPEELAAKYDKTGDIELGPQELDAFVNDESIPNCMAVVLRRYAARLAQVGAELQNADQQDDLALAFVHYFKLDGAKDHAKLGVVINALGNGSLPLPFAANVLAQLCLTHEDADALTSLDVSTLVISMLVKQHSAQTMEALGLLYNATWWHLNGLNDFEQPRCLRTVTKWVADAQTAEGRQELLQVPHGETALGDLATDRYAMETMPQRAERRAEEALRQRLMQRQKDRAALRCSLYASETSQLLMSHLLGGVAASDVKNLNAERVINRGQQASPETLAFAARFSAGLLETARRHNEQAFSYSSESSNVLDSVATQIQQMVRTVQSFLNLLKKWGSANGIEQLEQTVRDFSGNALRDVLKVVEHRVQRLVNSSMGSLAEALEGVGAKATSKAISDALDKPLSNALSAAIGNETGQRLGHQMAPILGGLLTDALDEAVETLADKLHGAIEKAQEQQKPNVALFVQVDAAAHLELSLQLSATDAWTNVVNMLRTLTNILPTATEALNTARQEVSKAAAGLDSSFTVFEAKGPPLFDSIASLWRVLWSTYFCILMPLCVCMLYYGFWSSGFFGGPQPLPEGVEKDVEPPKSWRDKLAVCWASCSVSLQHVHDTPMCFWSVVLLMQVLALVVFLISIALCILAGVKAFISSGCAQVYLLGDDTVCTEAIRTLRDFLSTFFITQAVEELNNVCTTNSLLTCELIGARMRSSVLLTTLFSFLGALVSLQMIIESAVLHEQARYRRMYNARLLEDEEGGRAKADSLADAESSSSAT